MHPNGCALAARRLWRVGCHGERVRL